MRILIADDDDVSRLALEAMLIKRGNAVATAADGAEAWHILQTPDAPRLLLLDWMMPELDGLEICRRLRATPKGEFYIILLTAMTGQNDLVKGLDAGADDYITKPFDKEELRARLQAGRRVLDLQKALAARVGDLEEALSQVKQLGGLLPICCYCKKIRDDQHYWQQVEGYISRHTHATFSHGICPDCLDPLLKSKLEPGAHVS